MRKLILDDVSIRAKISPQMTELSFTLTERAGSGLKRVAPVKWAGRIRGPICSRSQTLAANYVLSGEVSGKSARTIIPDFCHWTSELPFTYDLEFQLQSGGHIVAEFREKIAVPWILLHRGKLYRSGKRLVPRMARIPKPTTSAKGMQDWLEDIRTNELVLVIRASDASDDFLSDCQRMGVSLAIEMTPTANNSITRFEGLGCVLMLLAPNSMPAHIDTSLLVATPCDQRKEESQRWEIITEPATTKALIATRPGGYLSPAEARRACDDLQACTADEHDWAGYLV